MWKRLPMEAKNLWQKKGNQTEDKMKTTMCMNLKLSQGAMESKAITMIPMQNMKSQLNFLNMKMM
jgi:hypothetical protein